MEITRESGIYKITNIVRDKTYVGSAADLYQRRQNHVSQLKAGKHSNKKLQNAWNKYGADAFVFTVLELAEKSILAEREQHWMNALKAVTHGYNIYPNARTTFGRKLSAASKKKIGKANTGKKRSAEQRAAMSKAAPRDRVRSSEEIAKRSAAMTGKKHTEFTKQKLREKAIGRLHSKETREKMSADRKGRKMPEAARRATAAAHTGMKRSDEAKAKMSAAQKLRFKTKPPSRDENGRLTCSCGEVRSTKPAKAGCRP